MALPTAIYALLSNRWTDLSRHAIIDFASFFGNGTGIDPTTKDTPMESMSHRWLDRWLRRSDLSLALPLLLLVLAINVVAIWGIVSGRAGALEAVRKELELRTLANARSIEALLATLRGDFIFLARSPPLARFLETRADRDPLVRRWSRLDAEATLLLFLEANPVVEQLVLTDAAGQTLVVAGRPHGVPELFPAEIARPAPSPHWLRGVWPVGDETGAETQLAHLEAWIDHDSLLAFAAPGLEERLVLEPAGAVPVAPAEGELSARSPVVDEHWNPVIRWQLVRTEPAGRLLRSVETLAGSLGANAVLNLVVITLTLVLGSLGFRHVRRAARLAAEAEHQTRVRALEQQLARSERLASVGRLAAGIAHEINNPLEGMANHLALLDDDLAAGDTESARRQTLRVREGLDRTAAVIRQVLAFASTGGSSLHEVDLGRTVAETVAFVRRNPAYQRIELRFEPAAEPLACAANPVTLGQLFLNLVLNACQVQPGGGEVEVKLRREGAQAVVTVADRGPGFAPEVLKNLFEPFVSTRGGSGLGLAVSHGIVRDHGGEIRVRNRGGGGAEVEIWLPLGGRSMEAVS